MDRRISCRLTVFFDGQFWVGLIEVDDGHSYKAARHVFGAEPTEPEVLLFAFSDWSRLKFTENRPMDDGGKPSHKVSYKRMLRDAKRQLEKNPLKGTAAQRALQEQRECDAKIRASEASERRAQKSDAAYELRKAKQKAHHRGK